MFKKNVCIFLSALVLLGLFSCGGRDATKILVFSKTDGFEHKSIPAGIKAIMELGAEHDFKVDTTQNAATFTEDSLQQYNAVVFLNTTGDVLNHVQQADFQRYIEAGGGFMGIHAAADTEYHWPWYGKLVGGYFKSHPKVQNATVNVVDKSHVATRHLPDNWERIDEWYNYKSMNPNVTVLAKLDETTYEGGENGEDHPIIWYHNYDGGRSFYTGGGHTSEAFQEPEFREHLLNGIKWTAGEDELDYGKATTLRVPNEDRFQKEVLAKGFDEPVELAVLDNGDVLIVERKGGIKYYNAKTEEIKMAGKLDVYAVEEDGLLGAALDPEFAKNHWVYLYYSPAGDEAVNVLSRFVLKNGELDMTSEKQIIKVPVQREECCHTGGSIAFDAEGNLYLSTGDNTNPFASDGYAPLDARPGRSSWDARRSSANTDDLRGKILRIHPEDDGTYTIPKGNLFDGDDASRGRPEIYVMGNRNPYRISIDPKTGFLYWGEVGPDAGKDSIQGPKGYDEINQAREAGNFGWPLLIGDNIPYAERDFETGKTGELSDPVNPLNNSPHNTGAEILPVAREAFIWYPYEASEKFPLVGEGGRTAMAGPVYYSDLYPESEIKFPKYYDGKLFIYEWMRNWIMAVTMTEEGDYLKMEPFLPGTEFSRPMDMEFGPKGTMYILEYGQDWFKKNEGAKLVRIKYGDKIRKTETSAEADGAGTEAERGHQVIQVSDADAKLGEELISNSDCRACHAMGSTVVGPSFLDIAEKYSGNPDAKEQLVENIIKGSRGVWGDRPMAAHPQLSKEEAGAMVNYILSLERTAEAPE